MTKNLSSEALVALYNKLSILSPRGRNRYLIITEAAEFYGTATATIYRHLRKYNRLISNIGEKNTYKELYEQYATA